MISRIEVALYPENMSASGLTHRIDMVLRVSNGPKQYLKPPGLLLSIRKVAAKLFSQ